MVETTCAGDAFLGGFLSVLLNNNNNNNNNYNNNKNGIIIDKETLKFAVQYGNAAGALTCW